MRRKKFITFTVFVALAVSVLCAAMIKSTKRQTLTVTDVDGVTYVGIIDNQNTEVYAGVTDKDGNMYAAKMVDGVVLKDQPLYVVENYEGTFPVNDTTRTDDISINQNNDEDINFTGEAETKATTEPAPTKKNDDNTESKETTESKQPKEYLSEKFIRLFNSGIFTMTFKADDPDLTEDITIAMKNGSIYMDTSMEGISCKVIYDANKKSGYIIIPQLRTYCALPEDLAKDMSSSDFAMRDISEAKKIDVSEVTIDGKDFTCEKFTFDDSVRSFYFYKDKLIRMTVEEDGETTLYNIISVSSDVDNSYFEIPRGYLKMDLSWLQTQG